MSYRGASSYTTPESTALNLQRESYDYGYGGGRTDLPSFGYSPVYPSTASAQAYTGQHSSSAYVHGQPVGYQNKTQDYTFANPYASNAEYNPDYSNFNSHRYHQEYRDPTPTSIITVNKSRYSAIHSLKKYFTPPKLLHTISSTLKEQTFEDLATPSVANPPVVPAVENEADNSNVRVVEEVANNQPTSQIQRQNAIASPPSINSGNSNPGGGGKIMHNSYQEHATHINRMNYWQNQEFGRAPWHRSPPYANYPGPNMPMPYPSYGPGSRRPPVANSRNSNSRMTTPYVTTNNKDLIPFVVMPEDMESLTLKLDPNNLECFYGPSNIFTMQHVSPVLIEESIYESIEHYYQYRKLMDLCGNCTNKITGAIRDRHGHRKDGKKVFNKNDQTFSFATKEQLRLYGVSMDTIEQWRITKGVKAFQDAYAAKVSQDHDLRMALLKSGEKIMVHAFDRDTVYGIGIPPAHIKRWCTNMKSSGNNTLKIPAEFPLTEETVKHCPTFCHGRNILGVVLMQLREKVVNGSIAISDMKALFTAIKEGKEIEDVLLEDIALTSNDFSIGGGTIQSNASMET